VPWEARERDSVSDVFDASDEHDKTLETEAEPGVGAGAELAQVQVPSNRWGCGRGVVSSVITRRDTCGYLHASVLTAT
jgi:hypothetical protein